jgi:hypothetical protein
MSAILYTDDPVTTGLRVGSPAWFTWLTTATTFYFESPDGSFTAIANGVSGAVRIGSPIAAVPVFCGAYIWANPII